MADSFIIQNSSGSVVLTALNPLDIRTAGVYYFKRCKVDSPNRKLTIDSSPSAEGSFVQEFGDHSFPVSGGTIALVGASEAAIRTTFNGLAGDVKQQIGLTLTIPNETGTFPHCVNTAFELMRRPDGRMFVPNEGNTTFRAYVAMEFVQLSL